VHLSDRSRRRADVFSRQSVSRPPDNEWAKTSFRVSMLLIASGDAVGRCEDGIAEYFRMPLGWLTRTIPPP
jgi:hypothetical protein